MDVDNQIAPRTTEKVDGVQDGGKKTRLSGPLTHSVGHRTSRSLCMENAVRYCMDLGWTDSFGGVKEGTESVGVDHRVILWYM